MASEPHAGLRHSSWDIFVLCLSILSLANIALLLLLQHVDSRRVIFIIDGAICIVFLADFLLRLRAAESKRAYFLRGGGWLDLLGSIPVPGLRIARGYRVYHAWKEIRERGGTPLWRDLVRERAQGALYIVLLLVVLVLEFASIGVLHAERGAEGANIETASDALWWGYVTITTVGYGDEYPVTDEGRIVGIFLLTIGVGLFGTFTAFVANIFLAPRRRLRADGPASLAELRSLLEEQERIAEQLHRALDTLEAGARHPGPP